MCVRRLFVPGALLFLAGCGVTMTTDPLVTHGERIAVFDQPGWRLTLGPDKEAIPLDLSFVPSNRSYRINSKAKAWCFTANAVPFDSGYLVSVTVNEDRAGKIHEVLTDEECGFLSPLFLNIELMLDRTDYCVSALVVDSGREPCRISSLSSKELCALLKRGGASFKRIGILSRAEPNTNERRPAAGSPGPAALVPKVAGQIAETNLTRVTDSNYWCPRFVIPPDSAGAETNGSLVLEHAAVAYTNDYSEIMENFRLNQAKIRPRIQCWLEALAASGFYGDDLSARTYFVGPFADFSEGTYVYDCRAKTLLEVGSLAGADGLFAPPNDDPRWLDKYPAMILLPPLGHTREFEEGLAMTADAKALARLLFDLRVAHCVTDGLKIEIGPRQKIRTQGKGHVSVQK